MSIIQTVPNQWVIKIKKTAISEDTTYMRVNMDALEKAAKDLKAGAFKLWIYFAKNQNDYTFALSPQHVKDIFGMSKTQYDNARGELEEKGYLVIQDRNYYHFCETPIILTRDERIRRVNYQPTDF
jgi:predicted RNA-binding protein (virulence factor B family)